MGFDSFALSELFDASIILIADGDAGLLVDKCILVEKSLKAHRAKLMGVIINNIPENDIEGIKNVAVPALEKRGISVLGLLPHSPMLHQIRTSLVTEKLGAKVLAGENGMNRRIGKILVGAMRADTALQMRSLYEPDKLLITGGDRVDMIMTAFDTSTSCIVLTGNLVPHPRILARADELEVPLISVPTDTYTTAQMIERIKAETGPDDKQKLDVIKGIVGDEVDLSKLTENR
jgi:BioD-like phosphotransacetylase family protein